MYSCNGAESSFPSIFPHGSTRDRFKAHELLPHGNHDRHFGPIFTNHFYPSSYFFLLKLCPPIIGYIARIAVRCSSISRGPKLSPFLAPSPPPTARSNTFFCNNIQSRFKIMIIFFGFLTANARDRPGPPDPKLMRSRVAKNFWPQFSGGPCYRSAMRRVSPASRVSASNPYLRINFVCGSRLVRRSRQSCTYIFKSFDNI